jgi:hypothetical protein
MPFFPTGLFFFLMLQLTSLVVLICFNLIARIAAYLSEFLIECANFERFGRSISLSFWPESVLQARR